MLAQHPLIQPEDRIRSQVWNHSRSRWRSWESIDLHSVACFAEMVAETVAHAYGVDQNGATSDTYEALYEISRQL